MNSTINKSNRKILIINSSSLTSQNATGITLRSIFSIWDVNCLYEISCAPSSKVSLYKGRKLNILPHKYYPIHYLLNMSFFRNANNFSKEKHNNASIRKGRNISSFIRSLIISYADSLPLIPPKEVLNEIKNFDPDYIYTMGGSILPLKLALYFSKKLDKKIVIHFMDNWQDTLYNNNIFVKPCRILLLKVLRNTYLRMNKGLTISEKMAKEYSLRWKKEHISIMNIIDGDLCIPKPYKETERIKIIYTGGLHLDRWRSLLSICEVIDRINNITSNSVFLDIYTSDSNRRLYESLFVNKCAVFHEFVSHDEIRDIYLNADILLHMESFESRIIEFVKYSMSTKISEYMASGTPILLYAPSELAVTEYVEKSNCGVACKNEEELYEAIIDLSQSADLRYRYGINGINCAKMHQIGRAHV